jgi:hypothetical protein
MDNTFGHTLKPYSKLTGYLICDNCGMILYKSLDENDNKLYISDRSRKFITTSGPNELNITCNEVMIKNLLE